MALMRAGRPALLAALLVAALASVLAALAVGSVPVGLDGVLGGARSDIVYGLRAPRALAGFAAGALLALAGALLQALLRNPLADPYVLGVSGGAAAAALLAMAVGVGAFGVQLAAVGGALAALALLFVLARRALLARDAPGGETAVGAVLLTGVMIASFAAALMSLLLTLAPEGRLRSMVFWLIGDLGGASDLRTSLFALTLAALLFFAARPDARALNLVLRGDLQAFTQGVDVGAARRRLVVIAAAATAIAVTLAGAVGFVGFVAPHLVRLAAGNDQRTVLPAAMLLGGVLVVVADTVARTIVAPLQLPVGVLTALLGVPVFLWLLARRG